MKNGWESNHNAAFVVSFESQLLKNSDWKRMKKWCKTSIVLFGLRLSFARLFSYSLLNRKLFIFYALRLHIISVNCKLWTVQMKMIFNVNSSRDLRAYSFLLLWLRSYAQRIGVHLEIATANTKKWRRIL